MRAQSRMKLWREGSVNCFLLCTVVAKQTRHLGRLMPQKRTAELITMALTNCADHELEFHVDAAAPEVVREEAARMGRLTDHLEPVNPSGPEVFGEDPDSRCSFGYGWGRDRSPSR